jgi:hypothetical protein
MSPGLVHVLNRGDGPAINGSPRQQTADAHGKGGPLAAPRVSAYPAAGRDVSTRSGSSRSKGMPQLPGPHGLRR